MCGVTAAGHTDGFGSQYAAMLSVVALSEDLNQSYRVTPWTAMEHGEDPMALFAFVGGPLFGPPAINCTRVAKRSPSHPLIAGTMASTAARALRNYYAVPKPLPTGGLVVHVRRGDVTAGGRWTSPHIIARCIRRTMPTCGALHIVSEGSAAGLEWSAEFNATLHLNEVIDVTFHRMVTADCLIMAKSTLSWSAAFLSDRRLFAPHFTNHRIAAC